QETSEGVWQTVEQDTAWAPNKTCVIICDMWNKHWCNGATQRVGEIVPKMNRLVSSLRDKGVFIIHAPSGTMDHYKDLPQRKLAQEAKYIKPPVEIAGWCYLDLDDESQLPIDDSDGGCDCTPQCEQYTAWSMQHPGLTIAPQDAISDDGQEIFNLLAARGIDNVIIMGVHCNMCVLGRPFGIRQQTRLGKNVVLVRDMTDTMYNSRMYPHVDHNIGTRLVIQHVEKYWAPTVTSTDLMDNE
ncbi:protein-signal peptide and transmembrane prediction, partial [bacterium]|nr:protein-signal peptide and transmembrane prediction [bacterium]